MEFGRPSVEDKIREAQARGVFDDLPGKGKPLRLSDDPDWWVKSLMQREQIDTSVLVHPTVALRREADGFPESLAELTNEDQVRAVLTDFNARVVAEWRRPAVGPTPPIAARQVAVEPMVDRWRALRDRLRAEAAAPDPSARSASLSRATPPARDTAIGWWARWRRGRRPTSR
jgi:hypothetical protein